VHRKKKTIIGIFLFVSILVVLFVLFVYLNPGPEQSICGVWTLVDEDRSLFGLKDYVLYIGSSDKQETPVFSAYLMATNENFVLYDDIVDLVLKKDENPGTYATI